MKRRIRGLTLVEIVMALVILSLTMSGMLSVIISAKRITKHSRSRTTGGELARVYLEPLAMEVRQDQWTVNCVGSSNCTYPARTLNFVNYTQTIVVSALGVSSLRRVRLDLHWND